MTNAFLPDLVVSIINYRTADLTIAAATSALDAFGQRKNAALVVVDNASGDGSDGMIETWMNKTSDARVTLIRSATNSGFSGGHNQAIAAFPDAAYYLILNSDALLRAGFFEAILDAAAQNPQAGLIAPRLEWEDGTPQESCFRFAGPASEFIRAAGSGPVTRLLQRYVVPLPISPDPADIRWASFACILLRGEMVRDIGMMDEGYFLYFEDAEYALRARRKGWHVTFAPAARAVHFRGGSGPVKEMQAEKKRLPAYYWRSRMRFFRQTHGFLGPFLCNLTWIAGRFVARLRLLTGRSVPKVYEQEWRDIWTNFMTPLQPDMEPRR